MNIARFNLTTLTLVASIARAGSISKGARELNMAIAAASKRVADFEAELGVAIFYRRPSGMVITEAGRAIVGHILNVLGDLDRLNREAADLVSSDRGKIRLWVSHAAISGNLPSELASFVRSHPNIAIEMEERESTAIIKAIHENSADIGIFAANANAAGLATFLYRTEELVLVVPAKHPLRKRRRISLATATQYDFVGLLRETPLAVRLDYEAKRLGQAPGVRVEVRTVEAMCRMISAGLGIGILPLVAVEPFMGVLRLHALNFTEDWATRELMLGVRDGKALPNGAHLLLEHLKAGAAKKAR
ncbi:MAG TPA: LysR family transcriptional regulator [Stellaceae bacterium]|jgi:DNA-binding transcriptional LysR family regulator|nr:LysR family transcriptional regulator [Stellaceae bacterium]